MCGVATLTCFAEFGKATFAAVGVENDEFSSPAGNGTAAINDLAFITDVQKLMATTQILCNQNSTWVAPHEFGLGDLDAKDAFYCINFKKEP
ncbi:hypothetical protein AAVH_12603 [Aphelenchoides avenae]|nr:hypothetical protein AAVH_12603 [Aphelenchus avenae]